MWRTGKLAKLLGIDRSVIHYYNSVGVLHAKRDENNYLSYDSLDFIALCKARQLRSMGFSLEETTTLLRDAGEEDWQRRLALREQEIDREIRRLENVKYLVGSHQGKYRPLPSEFLVLSPFHYGGYYYLPLDHVADWDTLALLVKDAPYINYCFHVPPGGGTCPEQFRVELGVSFQEWWRDLAPPELPAGTAHFPECSALASRIELRNEAPPFSYDDLAFVRAHCAAQGLVLTGEAMAFPAVHFLEQDREQASAKIFFFLVPPLDC